MTCNAAFLKVTLCPFARLHRRLRDASVCSAPAPGFQAGRVVLSCPREGAGRDRLHRNILYFQNYGGGGAGLGLLLGPIGVAANMSMIESNTKQEQLRDKIAIDPPAVFSAAAGAGRNYRSLIGKCRRAARLTVSLCGKGGRRNARCRGRPGSGVSRRRRAMGPQVHPPASWHL
jgi:hypothetical protein